MITSINSSNVGLYRELFEKASDYLAGYDRVRTFDIEQANGDGYYYKNPVENKFIKISLDNPDGTDTSEVDKMTNFFSYLEKYALYVKKFEAVKGFYPEVGITTLEEYYSWLPQLKRDSDGNPTKYTILPLDKNYFKINANTRAIEIPNDFKKNGIAVQGDDLAEVVYFKIDRFFDAMDLNNTIIYIEWETPKGKDEGPVKGISDVYIRDIDSEHGQLIFGWAISDAITKTPGTLKFSVRFLQYDTDATGKPIIAYSFNTLTAQVAIHPSLNLDLESGTYEPDNCNSRLLERIVESQVSGGAEAQQPVYLINLEDGEDCDIDPVTGEYHLEVLATSPDLGAISYVWKRREINESNGLVDEWLDIEGEEASFKYIRLTEAELKQKGKYIDLDEKRTYFIAINSDEDNLKLLSKADYKLSDTDVFNGLKDLLDADWDERTDLLPIFEKRATLTVKEYGLYWAEAKNRIQNSIARLKSKEVKFPRPDLIVIDTKNHLTEGHIIGEDSNTLAPDVVDGKGLETYQWLKANPSTNDHRQPANSWTLVLDAESNSFTPDDPGFYKLRVKRERNKNTTEYTMENYYRVTNAPEVPVTDEWTVEKSVVTGSDFEAGGAFAKGLTFEFTVTPQKCDNVYVEWYHYSSINDKAYLITTQKMPSPTTADPMVSYFNPLDDKYAPDFNKHNLEDREGLYYAVAQNELNGVKSDWTEAPANADYMYTVIDI